jgi:hypothetical protein
MSVRYQIVFVAAAISSIEVFLPASTVLAAPKSTPVGPVDESCIFEIPNRGHIDLDTGDVSLDGVRVSHHDRCRTSPTPVRLGPGSQSIPAADGWYAWTEAHATTISGMTQFDYLDASWTVPANPNDGNSSIQYFFDSLQNSTAPCPTCALMQPVLSWNRFHAGTWEMSCWIVYGCDTSGNNCGVGHSPPVTVRAGDTLDGYMQQYAGGGGANDSWYVSLSDYGTEQSTYMSFASLPSWPKFSVANAGVFEGFSLSSCSHLSATSPVRFSLQDLEEAGPAWNSHNVVLPGMAHAPTWNGRWNTVLTPQCSYGATIGQNIYTYLSWTH